jgi:hypothetical protein
MKVSRGRSLSEPVGPTFGMPADKDSLRPGRRGRAGRLGTFRCVHQVSRVVDGRIVTAECGQAYAHRSGLFRHRQTHAADTCGSCLEAVAPGKMAAHSARCNAWRACVLCGTTFESQVDHAVHISSEHTDELELLFRSRKPFEWNATRLAGASKKFSCDDCGQSFSRRDNVQKHHRMKRCRCDKRCPDCGKQFFYQYHFRIHVNAKCGLDKPLGL